jgi:hypothetical protein
MPNELLIPLISAASGLLGVAVGGYFAAHNQKRERQQHFVREQLTELYGPMLALRARLLAKSEARLKISSAAGAAWSKKVNRAYKVGMDEVDKLEQGFSPFEKITDYDNHQFKDEILPAYRRMEDLCVSKMHLAERSTRGHFAALTEFVEVWNRWLTVSIPGAVVQELAHSEVNLHPLYEDLAENFERLQHILRE